ncbi:uncharacterized protein EI97DRAFT_459738 [Westerdykella ornata]|uniref:Hyaluronan/mRNA-binding protein domain-containing protein n=1 Tax=Westerdykella ornata TaxID=318751 RepID=A0A6A6JEX5_WESOR|nr:uncharacterized protein EI97DRAFT_459738 [Westerdykella ornata]KAF2275111.1 hypothetical protein EI97DRAFT_459738 [Westerdykella ornata]
MSAIASKNLYELLGNDPELDPDRPAEPPTKAVDKPLPRTGKRNAPAEAPASQTTGTTGRTQRQGPNANENAFRDRGVGSDKNRSRGSGEPGEHVRGRGGFRGRGRGRSAVLGDRHSRTGIAEHEKQAAHGWGAQDGNAEWDDEKAGEAIAKADEKEEGVVATPAEEPEPEPEDKTKSYAAYLAELAEKKLSLAAQNVRKANEGSSAKFPEGKPVTRDEDEAYIAGSGGKAKRERERKQKEFVELDDAKLHREARDTSFRGRGRGRGEFRGEGRGRGGEGRGRGGARGRGEGRGGRGGRGQSGPNLADPSAFPSLGS